MSESIQTLVTELARDAKRASRALVRAETERKNAVLLRAAAALRGPEGDRVIEENAKDLAYASEKGLSKAMIDRLRLDRARLDGVAEGVEQIATLPDPVGEMVEERRLANGLQDQENIAN